MFSVKAIKLKEQKKKTETERTGKKRKIFPLAVVCILVLSVVLLLALTLGKVPDRAEVESFSYSLVAESNEEREKFWKQFGFEGSFISQRDIFIPEKGEEFEKYNKLQIEQGLDLRGFGGLEATEYVFELTRDDLKEPLFGVMTVYKNRVIALHFDEFEGGGVKGVFDIL